MANENFPGMRFDFKSQNIGKKSTEANIFIHGYSAGHDEEDRRALLDSIPKSFRKHTNIFAFWPSNHFARPDNSSSLNSIGFEPVLTAMPYVLAPFLGLPGVTAAVVQNRVKNFTDARTRAERMGSLLPTQLTQELQQYHPEIDTVNLIGHSLGGRVIVSALKALANNPSSHLKINDVLLMAAAVEVQPTSPRI